MWHIDERNGKRGETYERRANTWTASVSRRRRHTRLAYSRAYPAPPVTPPLLRTTTSGRVVPCPEWEFRAHRSSGGTTTGGRRPESRPWAAQDWRPHRLTWYLYVTPEPTTSAAGRTSQRSGRREEKRETFEKRVEGRGGVPYTGNVGRLRGPRNSVGSGLLSDDFTPPLPLDGVTRYSSGSQRGRWNGVLRGDELDSSGNKERCVNFWR